MTSISQHITAWPILKKIKNGAYTKICNGLLWIQKNLHLLLSNLPEAKKRLYISSLIIDHKKEKTYKLHNGTLNFTIH